MGYLKQKTERFKNFSTAKKSIIGAVIVLFITPYASMGTKDTKINELESEKTELLSKIESQQKTIDTFKEQERKEQARKEQERKEQERKEQERKEQERKEKERKEQERKEQERKEQERKEQERKEQERKEQERKEQERKEKERKEQERKEQEQQQIQGVMSNPNTGSGITGYCNDGTPASGDPSAKGRANSCYGHKGWAR